METQTINIYKFSELSKEAQERATTDHAKNFGYEAESDAWASMEALAAHFGAKIDDYSFDYFGGPTERLSFEFQDGEDESIMKPAEIERRLKKLGSYNKRTGRGNGDCVLTGYCADEDAIDGFRLAWRAGVRDLSKLLRAAFASWLKAAQDDCEYAYGEGFAETADANEWRFTEDGKFYSCANRRLGISGS